MKDGLPENPFRAGTGSRPPRLAGREAETKLLAKALDLLGGARENEGGPLARDPLPPIKIVGPRGVGKTVLLTWAKKQAEEKGKILVIRSAYLDDDGRGDPMQSLVNAMKKWPAKVLETLKEAGVSFPGGFGVNFKTDRPPDTYEQLIESIVRVRPLLMLLDEVHHYDLRPLGKLLQVNQQLISDGYPLGMVLAGTPALNSHLAKARATFIARSKHIDIHVLSDAATREALREPFKRKGVKVAPDALEAMAVQTDNYPYFIQLVGETVWDAMEEAGPKEVDAALVRRSAEQARKDRSRLYDVAWDRMRHNNLLPYAHQVIDLLERNKGRVPKKNILALLRRASGSKDDEQVVTRLYEGLQEDGMIWTVDGETKPGIPSFFNYCKSIEQDNGPSSNGAVPRNLLFDLRPDFLLPNPS